MANRLVLHLDEWRDNLRAEPAALATDADPIVSSAAEQAAAAVQNAYPRGETGNLKAGVRVTKPQDTDPAVAAAVVVSGAPHAHLYEDGTRYQRPKPTYWPIVNAHGAAMLDDVSRMVEGRNFRVTGSLD